MHIGLGFFFFLNLRIMIQALEVYIADECWLCLVVIF